MDMIGLIFRLLSVPTVEEWPDFETLPLVKTLNLPNPYPPSLRQRFPHLTVLGLNLLSSMLTYDPEKRVSAEQALSHPYFKESPLPKHPDMFPSFPSLAAGERRAKAYETPPAPERAKQKVEYDYV